MNSRNKDSATKEFAHVQLNSREVRLVPMSWLSHASEVGDSGVCTYPPYKDSIRLMQCITNNEKSSSWNSYGCKIIKIFDSKNKPEITDFKLPSSTDASLPSTSFATGSESKSKIDDFKQQSTESVQFQASSNSGADSGRRSTRSTKSGLIEPVKIRFSECPVSFPLKQKQDLTLASEYILRNKDKFEKWLDSQLGEKTKDLKPKIRELFNLIFDNDIYEFIVPKRAAYEDQTAFEAHPFCKIFIGYLEQKFQGVEKKNILEEFKSYIELRRKSLPKKPRKS